MSAAKAEPSFSEMLEANQPEAQRWQHWFERQPVELPDFWLSIAMATEVRVRQWAQLATVLRQKDTVPIGARVFLLSDVMP